MTGRDAKIRGLILAAGRGSRMGSVGDANPKCLLEVGRRPLIEHQLEALAGAGVGPTALVLGYAADEVQDVVGIRAEYIVNTRWNRTNSLYSFWLAREWLTGPVLVLNSDVLFSPEILERLLAVEGDAVAVDTSSGSSREQMKVEIVAGRLADMRKDLPADRICGENVGILKLTAETVAALLEEAERLIADGGEKSWLGSALRRVAADRPVAAVDVAGLPWVEIDFANDLARARKEVWPEIAGQGWKRRRRMRLAAWAVLPLMLVGLPLGLHTALPPPLPSSWETLDLDAPGRLALQVGERTQAWWRLDPGEAGTARVLGPGPVQIDTRLLEPEPNRGQYVLEVELDGQRVDWFKLETKPSSSAKHPGCEVGKRKRITLEVSDGVHEVDLRMVAPTTHACLVRVRMLEDSTAD